MADSENTNMKKHETSNMISFPKTPRAATIPNLQSPPSLVRTVVANTSARHENNQEIFPQMLLFPIVTKETQQELEISDILSSKIHLDDSMIRLPKIKLKPRNMECFLDKQRKRVTEEDNNNKYIFSPIVDSSIRKTLNRYKS